MLINSIKEALTGIVGKDRYQDAPEILICYAYDAFFEEALPEAVLFPITTQEVAGIVQVAGRHKIPITARGAGTSICGGPIPLEGGIVLCLSKMNRIIEVNTRDRYAIVQPGVINGDLQKALASNRFFFPPDPGSMNFSTIGGNVALNAGGPRCLKYGVTADYVLSMEVVLATGKVIRFGSRNVKDVTGYKLAALFCGSEGTLGIVTEITVRVMPMPEAVQTMMVTFADLNQTAECVSDIIGSGVLPVAIELMDKATINMLEDALNSGLPREAAGVLIIEVDGMAAACEQEKKLIEQIVTRHGATSITTAQNENERKHLWQARRAAYGVFAKLAPDIVSEDVTVPVSKVPKMIEIINTTIAEHQLLGGVLAHAGDGNMHPFVCADRSNTNEWERVNAAYKKIYTAAAELGGTLSGEHGIGLAKSQYMPLVMDEESRAFLQLIKKTLDPDNILNPGKLIG